MCPPRPPRAARSLCCRTAIEIDIPNRTLNVKLFDEELAKRKAAWKAPAPKVTDGYLVRYSKLVRSASYGAVVE